jgi:hypothetical protein
MNSFFSSNLFRSSVLIGVLVLALQSGNRRTPTDGMDGYDRPGDAIEFEIERTRDLSTGKVPYDQLWLAKQATEMSRSRSMGRINALSWTERGPNGDINGPQGNSRPNQDQTAGRIRAAIVDSLDPTRKTVWVGGIAGGLWKTTDITAFPATWTLVNDYLNNLAIASICQDPRPGFQNIMYFSTGESFGNADAVAGIGVFKSTDAGNTWNYLSNTSTFPNSTKILCDHQGNVYLATRGQGLQRSTDGGSSWTSITPTGVGTSIADIEISNTGGPGRLHVVSGIFSTSGYAFTDSPATATTGSGWSAPTAPFTMFNQRTELGISGNNLIALPVNGSYQVPTIWKSTDGGDNWASTTGQPTNNWANGQGWYDLSVAFNPNNPAEVIVGGIDNYKTIDGGITWSKISVWVGTSGQYVHADQHNIQWWDGGNKLMFTSDGGVHFSSNRGSTIRDRNKGLRLKQFYGIAVHPLQTNYFLGGTQDNGVHRLDHVGLDSSIEVTGGDGCYTAIDQNEPQFQFGSYVFNVYRRSTNNGASWSTPVNSQTTGRFVNPWDYDNVNNRIYACNNAGAFLRWENPQSGNTTTVIPVGDFAGQNVSAVQVSPYTQNRVFFGMGAGRVVRADDAHTAAPTTTVITPTGATGYVNCIAVGSSDQHLLAIYSNYNINNIWRSSDGGATWTACDGNLPNMPVRWALFHPDSDTRAFIATETGVWETDLLNGTSTIWEANNTFPNVRTDMIKYRSTDRLIAAGTHGRGIFTATVPAPSGYTFSTPGAQTAACPAPTSMSTTLGTIVAGGFSNPISLSATGNPVGTSVSFSANPITPGSSVTVTLNGTNTLSPGTYNITVTGTASGSSAQTRVLAFTIQAGTGPVITGQPAAQSVCSGASASFSITATGTYQWQLSTDGGSTWNNISGATNASYTFSGATTLMNGNQYRCTVTNSCGTTQSTAATLSVSASTQITQQPQSVSACVGGTQSFTVTATGGTISYQWQISTNGGSSWTNVPGAAAATYTLSGITLAMNGDQYRCVVNGTCPPNTATSNAATLSVALISISSQPSSVTICDGGNTGFSVTASGINLTYQWQINTGSGFVNLSDGGIYSGATTSSLNVTGATPAISGYQFRCLVASSSCTNTILSQVATLAVNTLPSIGTQPVPQTICTGSSVSFQISGAGTGATYQWQVNTGSGFINLTNMAPYSGVNTPQLTISATPLVLNGYVYRCVVSGACTPSAISDPALLTVNDPAVVSSSPSSQEVCSSSNVTFTVGVTSVATINYQWQLSTDAGANWTNISGANSTSYSLTGVSMPLSGNRYRCLVSNTTCPTQAASAAATLTVRQQPSVSLSASPLTGLLPGQVTTLTATPSAPTGGTYSYTWTLNNNAISVSGNSLLADITQVGNYQTTVRESWPGGLVCTASFAVVNITAVVSDRLFIFPSPNDGNFQVSYYNAGASNTQRRITIYDSKGSLVFDRNFPITGAYTLIPIGLDRASRGIYYVVVGDIGGKKLAEGKVHVR